MSKAKRHIHRYHRIQFTFTKVWACGLPDCNHYMPKHIESSVTGKASLCWACGSQFILDPENMKEDQPRCLHCRMGISGDDVVDMEIGDRLTRLKSLVDGID